MKFTIKQLAQKVGISEGTIRSWIMKPEAGKAYSSENINYTNLREKLRKYYEQEAELKKLLGCDVDEVEITKAARVTKVWVTPEELIPGLRYALHNYSLVTTLGFLGTIKDADAEETAYVFYKVNGEGYKAYSGYELGEEHIKIESLQ